MVMGLRWEYDVRCKFAVSSGPSVFDPGFSSPKGDQTKRVLVYGQPNEGELVGDDREDFSGFAFGIPVFALLCLCLGRLV